MNKNKKKFSAEKVKKITGAENSKKVPVPFYYAPPFLDKLQEWIEARLAQKDEVETQVELFVSKDAYNGLQRITSALKKKNITITVDQLASLLLEKANGRAKEKAREKKRKKK
ncbi:MAG: hypothetical protein HYW78_01320 [Parcubacteria group bacterium]|nr:hypothetical protein [Parcubacteria group bacterium]